MSAFTGGVASAPLYDASPSVAFSGPADHLLLELERVRMLLAREVLRLRAAYLLNDNEFRGLYISDEQVDAVLRSRLRPSDGNLSEPETPSTREITIRLRHLENLLDSRIQASLTASVPLPLVELARRFALSPAERDALLVCAAPEIDLSFETLYSYAQNDVTRRRPSPDLVLRLLFGAAQERIENRSLFSSDGKLFGNSLLHFVEESPDRAFSLLASPLRADERIVSFLLGRNALDARLLPFVSCVDPSRPLPSLHFSPPFAADLLATSTLLADAPGIVFLVGPRGCGKRSVAEAFSHAASRRLLAVDLRRALAAACPFPVTLSLLRRESALLGADLFLAHAESLFGDDPHLRLHRFQLEDALSHFPFSVLLGSEIPWLRSESFATSASWSTFELAIPSPSQRSYLWSEAIASYGCSPAPDVDLHQLAARFALTGGQIHTACSAAAKISLLHSGHTAHLTAESLHSAARSASSHGLRKLSQKVESLHDWSDLVLPPRYLQQLREVCSAEKYRHKIHSSWGFESRIAQGKGLNVLFSGASGTGKTMSAGIMARKLSLDLYKIDLSAVVSKYIGETEKQLNLIFTEAACSNAILFFDEADALFGKRSEVKDAHDRYANVEVAYLLQKMDDYEGIVILATNFRKNIDEAFARRIHYLVDFPFPAAEYREKIWRGMIPADAPLAPDVDFAFLARQFELAGGNIRNVVLAAAFLAADEDSPIRMEHFVRATSREFQKMGKIASRSDFREFYDLIRDPT